MYHKLIVNPAAGNGRTLKLLPYIEKRFKEKGRSYEIYLTKGPKDAIQAAKRAAKTFDILVAIGGDGTVNEVVNGMAGSDAILGTLPAGTGNDYARALGFPQDLEEACSLFFQGEIKDLDLGVVLNHYFVNCVGVGFDGTVAYYANRGSKYLKGFWVYILAILKSLVTYKAVEMEIQLDGRSISLSPTLIAVGIGQSYGGGMNILPNAITDDGLFDICVIQETGRLKTLFTFPRVINGRHLPMREVEVYRSQEVKLTMSSPVKLHIEGEVFSAKDLHFTMIPKGIKVLHPPKEGYKCE